MGDEDQEKRRRRAVIRNGSIGLVTIFLLILLEFVYEIIIKLGNVNLTEVFTVPFDLLLITFTLLIGAYFEGYTSPRDFTWAVLFICTLLIFASGGIEAYMAHNAGGPEYVPENLRNLFAAWLPDAFGGVTLVWAIFGIRG